VRFAHANSFRSRHARPALSARLTRKRSIGNGRAEFSARRRRRRPFRARPQKRFGERNPGWCRSKNHQSDQRFCRARAL